MAIAPLSTVELNYLQFPSTSQEIVGGWDDSQDIIMVHGLATNLAFWYHIVPALTVNHRVNLFDLRGHGRSSMPQAGYTTEQMAEDLKELLDHLHIKTAHLIGHSFGGGVILNFACRYPERVQSLILVDVRLRLLQPQQTLRDWQRGSRLQLILKKIGIELDENNPESGYQLLEEIARLRLLIPKGRSPIRRILSRMLPESSKRTSMRWLKLLDTTTARDDLLVHEGITLEQLQQMEIPTLGVYGEHSPTLPTAHALKQILPYGQLEFIPQAGHFFPISQPEKLTILIQKFLNQYANF